MNEKVGRMPMAEVLEGPWGRLAERKRLAQFDALVADEGRMERIGLIERILWSMDLTPLQFAELILDVLHDRMGQQPTRWQRIDASSGRRRA
jgi:hypothetical protein